MTRRAAQLLPLLALALLTWGCAAPLQRDVALRAGAGDYGRARLALAGQSAPAQDDRDALLRRARLLVLTLADGHPRAAEETANRAFNMLTTQGLNIDREAASVVLHEGVRIWKGEPFEQAMMYHYIALQKAMLAEWDNARAASIACLYLLRDFEEQERAVSRRSSGTTPPEDAGGFLPARADFAPAYLVAGIASRALGRVEESGAFLDEAARLSPSLRAVCDTIKQGAFNTVFIIDQGEGPVKVSGNDGASVDFVPRSRGTVAALRVAAGDSPAPSGIAVDVNALASRYLWNKLEGVRRFKSGMGDAMIVGGVGVAAASNDRDTRNAALGVALAGLLLKASATADLRHLEFLPRSVHAAAVTVNAPGVTVTVGDQNSARGMVLTDLAPPERAGDIQLRFVRLSPGRPGAWATRGQTLYANDRHAGRIPGDELPFIMGGRCVRTPSVETMNRYRQAGHLGDITLTELENIYREEGILWRDEDIAGGQRLHVLEGGDSLVPPLAGTAGYMRLFGQEHPAYQPRSQALRDYLAREGRRRAGM